MSARYAACNENFVLVGAGCHGPVVSITNVTGGPARFHVHVRFAGGAYARTLELDAHATALFDLREMRDKAIPDREGRIIPQDVTSGQFHWSVLSSGGETKLAGRADITSRSRRPEHQL